MHLLNQLGIQSPSLSKAINSGLIMFGMLIASDSIEPIRSVLSDSNPTMENIKLATYLTASIPISNFLYNNGYSI